MAFLLLGAAPAAWAQADSALLEQPQTAAPAVDTVSPISPDDSTLALLALYMRNLDSCSAKLVAMYRLRDSLIFSISLYQEELNEKSSLLADQVKALQEKERLFAEKEQLYKDAVANSNVDKVKLEGEIKSKDVSIDAKTREIAYLQKDIDAKELTLSTQQRNYEKVSQEKEYYMHVVDSLRTRLIAVDMENVKKDEANKYLQQRVKEVEAANAITASKKKKVRPIQGIALRMFRTPDWDIRLTPEVAADGTTTYNKVVRNRNAGDIEFDFVTGASVMLWDMTKYFNRGTVDSALVRDTLGRRTPEIRRFDQQFSYDLGIYVGFGGSNLFKNFYVGPSFRFVDFFYLTMGVNICEYEMLVEGYAPNSVIPTALTIDDITAKAWLVKPFVSLSIDLDFLSYIKR